MLCRLTGQDQSAGPCALWSGALSFEQLALAVDAPAVTGEGASELYADEWLGFSAAKLEATLEKAGVANVQTSVVHKEAEKPQFRTLLTVGDRTHPR